MSHVILDRIHRCKTIQSGNRLGRGSYPLGVANGSGLGLARLERYAVWLVGVGRNSLEKGGQNAILFCMATDTVCFGGVGWSIGECGTVWGGTLDRDADAWCGLDVGNGLCERAGIVCVGVRGDGHWGEPEAARLGLVPGSGILRRADDILDAGHGISGFDTRQAMVGCDGLGVG
jgi:hypothetical protein